MINLLEYILNISDINLILMLLTTNFTDLPNEIVLIIWMYLTHVEAIRSFGSMKCERYNRLLQTYCYKSIDFYTTTFSTFQLCCTQMLHRFRFYVKQQIAWYYQFWIWILIQWKYSKTSVSEHLYIVNMGEIKCTVHVKIFDFNDLPKQDITCLIIKTC